MTKRRTITDPGTIFRRYCDEYRKLEPQVQIPETLARRIATFVDDVAHHRTITPFTPDELATFGPTPAAVPCSIYFIEYLRRMSAEMKQQGCFTVSPTRACELLYNLSADEIYSPEIMRWKVKPKGSFLKSLPHHRDFKLSLRVAEPREHIDWTLSD